MADRHVISRAASRRLGELLWVAVIYLASELLVWALSLALRPAGLEYFSSILGMTLVFLGMVLLGHVCEGTDSFYQQEIKSKIDFINKNLGIGFPVPIVAISQEDALERSGVGRVVGNFLATNLIFWPLVFALVWGVVAAVVYRPRRMVEEKAKPVLVVSSPSPSPSPPLPPPLMLPLPCLSRTPSDTTATGYLSDSVFTDPRTASTYFKDTEVTTPVPQQKAVAMAAPPRHNCCSRLVDYYPIALSLSILVVVGIPVARQTGDDRVLDGCMLWFVWITTARLQGVVAGDASVRENSALTAHIKLTMTTLLNPVLLTTFGMTAYMRAKSAATGTPIATTLAAFSSGTPLSDLWSYQAGIHPLKPSRRAYFGAGDGALSILECGIVVWGLKLYECRRQLASRAGLAVALVSTAAAALNVFVSPLLGRFAMGMAGSEALAFAARCTTLALARPAVEALGGNQVVNAALVVSNGIVGQLLYPFVLGRLGVAGDVDDEVEDEAGDDPKMIAAGAAVGVNGAAMGVAYLYQQKSRAAPYAALSMTVFGVATVVFPAVEPFTGTLTALMG